MTAKGKHRKYRRVQSSYIKETELRFLLWLVAHYSPTCST